MKKIQWLIILILAVLCGCATTGPKAASTAEKPEPIFYPPPPDESRLQFLISFSSSDDFEASPSAFRKFIVGDEKKTKPIVKPYGVSVNGKKVYICDTVHNGIDILDFETRTFKYFRPKEESQLIDPINLDFDPAGNLYAADARRGQVVMFDPS